MDWVIALAKRLHSGFGNAYATPNKKPACTSDRDVGYEDAALGGIMDVGLNAESDGQRLGKRVKVMEDSADKFSLDLVEIKNRMSTRPKSVTFFLQGSIAELEKRADKCKEFIKGRPGN